MSAGVRSGRSRDFAFALALEVERLLRGRAQGLRERTLWSRLYATTDEPLPDLGPAPELLALHDGLDHLGACSAFADLIANIEPTCSDPTLTTSINKLDHRLRELLAEPGLGDSLAATRVLRNIIDLRVGQQHSGSKPYARMPSARSQLGLPRITSSWQQDWDTVRAQALRALRQLRLALDAARPS